MARRHGRDITGDVRDGIVGAEPPRGVVGAPGGPISMSGNSAGGGENALKKAPDGRGLPTLEIFPMQLDVIFFQNLPFTYILTGACYDKDFNGQVLIEPQGSGLQVLSSSLPMGFRGNTQIEIPIKLLSTQRTGAQFVTCTLTYRAIHEYFRGLTPVKQEVQKGNRVSFQYRVKA